MLQDLKYACRELIKNRWFTCITVLTLALGIGANTAIFGVVNRLLLNPLPYPDADELVNLNVNMQWQGDSFGFPAPNSVVGAWRDEVRSLDGIEAFASLSMLAYDDNGGRVLPGMRITSGLPSLLGVSPLLGRSFTPADEEAGAPAVVVLSYETWQRDYGGANDVLGRVLTLDEVPHVIIGVMPPRWDAFVGRRPDVWLPLSLDPAAAASGGFGASEAIARLRPGVDRDAVRRELDSILARVEAEAPRRFFGNEPSTARVEGPRDRIGASTRDALLVLAGAVGLVLLVACSNVANLLLARSASRMRELSLRSALGASAWRLVRALFAECLVLALAAGAVGVALGWATLRILVRLRPNGLPALADVQIDTTVVAFTFGLSAATALLFGLAPALLLRSRKLADALRHGASGTIRGGSGPRLRKLLVVAQMAMSVVLLVSAGLLVRSVIHLQNVDLGFDTKNL
ncbi:MAG TPA: ABC transporter permease, partial [Gammaproteobacteria bacterium]|nr:ABC transporter permease [Gammaproteobacteria bacterium]